MREHVRERIDRTVPAFYERMLKNLVPLFPVNPLIIVAQSPECRAITYEKLARIKGLTVAEVAYLLGSMDGCTHYERATGDYLIAYNTSGRSRTRIRWTLAHELGHIAAGHFQEIEKSRLSEAPPELLREMEEEADYFAASLLAPFPAIGKTMAKSAEDVGNYFGLSVPASNYRWTEYRAFTGEHPLDALFSRKWITLAWNYRQATKAYWKEQEELKSARWDY